MERALRVTMEDGGPEALKPEDAGVNIREWGKDHLSCMLYVESICRSDPKGIGRPDLTRVQANMNRHPGLVARMPVSGEPLDGSKYPIRLAGGREMPGPDYDEWDCIHDLECHGLVRRAGTGINPLFTMMHDGDALAATLRRFKAAGGNLVEFDMSTYVAAINAGVEPDA